MIAVGIATVRCPAADFGGPKWVATAGQLSQRALDFGDAGGLVDVAAPQCGQLTPPQTAENREQDQRFVLVLNDLGQADDLAVSGPSAQVSDPWLAPRTRHGFLRMIPSSTAVFMMALSRR